MGTRSLTIVQEELHYWDKSDCKRKRTTEYLTMYRQYDGYPDGHGAELVDLLRNGRMTNGIPCGESNITYFNGAGCLAAQLVAHFKDGPGGIYIEPTKTRNCGEEYTYIITVKQISKDDGNVLEPEPVLHLKVLAGPMTFFGMDLTAKDRSDDCVIFDGPVADWDLDKVNAANEARLVEEA